MVRDNNNKEQMKGGDIMNIHCGLGNTDIPPIGCREFDPNWCRLEMKCEFLKEGNEKVHILRPEKKQKREVLVLSDAYS